MLLTDRFLSRELGSLKSRIVMSAMTRGFADSNKCATFEMAEYYRRRAEGGVALLLTEGIIVDPAGDGYRNVPHLTNDLQAQSWTQVVDKVHAVDSKIFAQLWHCGRISHGDFTGGIQPVSSTARAADGINRQNNLPYAVPRFLESNEIPTVIQSFIRAAALAVGAGFDGVQLHCGHGYLIDQFLDSNINDRTDAYGGSIENRCRFLTELVKGVIDRIGSNRVIVRLSPIRDMSGLYQWPDLMAMLEYMVPRLESIGLRMLDVSCARADYFQTSGLVVRKIRPMWKHLIMGGASLVTEEAETEVADGLLDMVTWGRLLIANPDLPLRIESGLPISQFSPDLLGTLF